MGTKSYYAKAYNRTKTTSKTQQAYGAHLDLLKQAGKIVHYYEEPFNIRLAEGAYYKPDFLVCELDQTLTIIEVKGGKFVLESEKTALIKAKLVAEKFPFRMRMVWPRAKKDGGGWEYRNFSDDPEDEFFTMINKNPV
ncbi:MAG: DUF1064 domain-containing protein [Desulfobulbaceae bacterium]|nr:DUF1064 domain-containing protein [Desulfobulbaceae bacterium]